MYDKRPGAAHALRFLALSPILLGFEKQSYRWIQPLFLRQTGWMKWIYRTQNSFVGFWFPIWDSWYLVGCDPKCTVDLRGKLFAIGCMQDIKNAVWLLLTHVRNFQNFSRQQSPIPAYFMETEPTSVFVQQSISASAKFYPYLSTYRRMEAENLVSAQNTWTAMPKGIAVNKH